MNGEHITELLESAPLASLGERDLQSIRAHTKRCDECRRAYDAARVSSLLLAERAAEVFEPSPFFQTRVMAAIRERRAQPEPSPLSRMWKAAGALVYSMAAVVSLLAVLAFAVSGPAEPTELATGLNPDAAERLLLMRDNPLSDELTYGQDFNTAAEPESNYGQR